MTAPVHFRVEVLYETLDGPACGFQRRGRLTDDYAEVTCRKCRTACGLPEQADEQLTECAGDPFPNEMQKRRAA